MSHALARVVLIGLAVFVAFTAIYGAFFVIPDLPREWLDGGPFVDYTIPALALGLVVGPIAIVAAVSAIVRPEVAGLASMVAGATIVLFELVEIAIVGLAIVDYGVDEPVAWLQIVYLLVGMIQVVIGAALWRATSVDRDRWVRTGHHLFGTHA